MIYPHKIHIITLAVVVITFGVFVDTVYATTWSDATMKKFAEQECYFELPPGILSKIARIDSGGNTKALAIGCHPGKKCTASGLFQWSLKPWINVTTAFWGKPSDPVLRFDPIAATEVTAYELAQLRFRNEELIKRSGIDEMTGVYIGHLLGPRDSKIFLYFLASKPDERAVKYLSRAAQAHPEQFGTDGELSFKDVAMRIKAEVDKPGIQSISGHSGEFEGKVANTKLRSPNSKKECVGGITSDNWDKIKNEPYSIDPKLEEIHRADSTYESSVLEYRNKDNDEKLAKEKQQEDAAKKERINIQDEYERNQRVQELADVRNKQRELEEVQRQIAETRAEENRQNLARAKARELAEQERQNAREREDLARKQQQERRDFEYQLAQENASRQQEEKRRQNLQRQHEEERKALARQNEEERVALEQRYQREQQRAQQEQERLAQDRQRKQQEELAQLQRNQQSQQQPQFQPIPQLQQYSQLPTQQGQQPPSPQQSGLGQSFGQGANQPFTNQSANNQQGSTFGVQPTPSDQSRHVSLFEQIAKNQNAPSNGTFIDTGALSQPQITSVPSASVTSIRSIVAPQYKSSDDPVALLALRRALDTFSQLFTNMRGLF